MERYLKEYANAKLRQLKKNDLMRTETIQTDAYLRSEITDSHTRQAREE